MESFESIDAARTFEEFGLAEPILATLRTAGFKHPSEVQVVTIPAALEGKDCISQAKTGTGKTAAFLLPMLQRLVIEQRGCGLVLAPTRELAIQTFEEAKRFSTQIGAKLALAYGGKPVASQMPHIQRKNHLVIGTPGRVIDFYKRKALKLGEFSMVVLDEADRMFDMGFRDDMDYILRACGKDRQTMLFSATMPQDVIRLVQRHLNNPEKFFLSKDTLTVEGVQQVYHFVAKDRKRRMLLKLLAHEAPKLCLIFIRTKRATDTVARFLKDAGCKSEGLHGDMPQSQRERVLAKLRNNKINILVATDVAARGLDIQGITHVINYNIPEDPEVYVHRVGRTARMGEKGKALTLVAPGEEKLLAAVEFLINKELIQETLPNFDPGISETFRKKRTTSSETLSASYKAPDHFGEGLI